MGVQTDAVILLCPSLRRVQAVNTSNLRGGMHLATKSTDPVCVDAKMEMSGSDGTGIVDKKVNGANLFGDF